MRKTGSDNRARSGNEWPFRTFTRSAHVCTSRTTDVVAITNGCDYYCAVLCGQITASRLPIRSNAATVTRETRSYHENDRYQIVMSMRQPFEKTRRRLQDARTTVAIDGLIRAGQIAGERNGTIAIRAQCSLDEMIPCGHLRWLRQKVNF